MKAEPIIPTERAVQRAILEMCGHCFRHVYITHIPNGAHLAGDDHQRKVQGGKLVGDGMKKGFPDLIVMWAHNKVAFLEVKRPKLGKLSEDQIAVHAKLRLLGFHVGVVTSIEDAFAFLKGCGAPCSGELR